jgi:hypothetical protein
MMRNSRQDLCGADPPVCAGPPGPAPAEGRPGGRPQTRGSAPHKLLLFFALASTAFAQSGFTWKDLGGGRTELRENSKPVLVYNYGPQLKQGAPEDRRRCCYVFPLYTPAGISMLDDFPKDHFHHRGLFWAWPVVETGGKTYDHWMTMTARNRPGTFKTSGGHIEAESVWQADGRDIVKETVALTARPASGTARDLDLEVTLEALGAPVTLRGSRERGKSYGGVSARFAPREQTVVRADGQTLTKDEDLNPHRWAELEAVYGGKRAALRITSDASNPGAPYQWCLRSYGFIGASFPGRTAEQDGYTLQPGKPVTLKFRITATDLP